MGKSWTVRIATFGDGQAIVSLFNEVFQEERSIDHWEWKFLENPTRSVCIVVAEDVKGIVGQYALLPIWMNLQGQKILGAFSLDTMTHPNYRNQGMFMALAEKCYDYASLAGVRLLCGFPNEQSYHGFVNRLEWHHIGNIPILLKIFNPRVVIEKITKSATISAICERPARFLLKFLKGGSNTRHEQPFKIAKLDTSFSDLFDEFWLRIKNEFAISIWKDSNYLNWRYLSCPDTEYITLIAMENNALIGFIVLKCETRKYPIGRRHIGYIIDFLWLPDRVTEGLSLISAGERYLVEQGMDSVICPISSHNLFYQLFKKQGFFTRREGIRLIVRSSKLDLPLGKAIDLKHWNIVAGDLDIY